MSRLDMISMIIMLMLLGLAVDDTIHFITPTPNWSFNAPTAIQNAHPA